MGPSLKSERGGRGAASIQCFTRRLGDVVLFAGIAFGIAGCGANIEATKSGLLHANSYLEGALGVDPGGDPGLPSTDAAAEAKRHYVLGMRYLAGNDVPVDSEKAARELTLAADMGNVSAQYTVGALHAISPKDEAEKALAVKWFKAAARQGDARAQYQLGDSYLNGFGVSADVEKAADWYAKAAQGGHRDAEFMLAKLHLLGLGVAHDRAKALKLFADAATHGHPDARRYYDALARQMRKTAER